MKQKAESACQQVKGVEQNSELLISEQLAVNEVLHKETARLKRELREAQCVICLNAKPSKAFIPCGHVCVCASCWDGFAQNGGSQLACPACRRAVDFAHTVFIC